MARAAKKVPDDAQAFDIAGIKENIEKEQEILEEAQEAEIQYREAAAAEKERIQTAKEKLEAHLHPVREEITVLQLTRLAVQDKYRAALDTAKESRTKLREIDAEIEGIYKTLEDAGIPRVLVGVKKRRVEAVEVEQNHDGKTTLKPAMLGAFEPFTVTAFKRHGDRNRECTLSLMSDGVMFYAKRLLEEDKEEDGGFTVQSRRLSDVTTAPGWLETKDVAYAIVSHLNLRDKFPTVHPVSDPDTISVNGVPLAEAPDYKFEVVEEG